MSRTAEGPLPVPGRRAYASYLLRVWRLERSGGEVLRLTLMDTRNGEEQRFSRPEDLVRYLADPSNPPPPAGHDPVA